MHSGLVGILEQTENRPLDSPAQNVEVGMGSKRDAERGSEAKWVLIIDYMLTGCQTFNLCVCVCLHVDEPTSVWVSLTICS